MSEALYDQFWAETAISLEELQNQWSAIIDVVRQDHGIPLASLLSTCFPDDLWWPHLFLGFPTSSEFAFELVRDTRNTSLVEATLRQVTGHRIKLHYNLEPQAAPQKRGASYDEYLRSPVWRRTRELALEYYGGKCCLCNSGDRLNVHHRTYERKGHELLADLIVLCRKCHATYHGVDR